MHLICALFNVQLERIAQTDRMTLGFPCSWLAAMTVKGNALCLTGGVRTCSFQFETVRLLSNKTEDRHLCDTCPFDE